MNSESFWDHQIIRRLQLDVKCLLGDADRAGTDGEKGILAWIWSGCLDINGNIRFWVSWRVYHLIIIMAFGLSKVTTPIILLLSSPRPQLV